MTRQLIEKTGAMNRLRPDDKVSRQNWVGKIRILGL